jgi:signal transduction histidine kinase
VLSVHAPTALVFVGVAALGASLRWPMTVAGLVALAGPATVLCTVAVDGAKYGVAVSAAAAAMTGAVLGATRRQALERAHQSAEVEVAAARADAEEARAELLAGRNHVARELHDVLAHSLSALSLRLEALETLLGEQPAAVRQELDATKRLVREGLTEARGAVQALREDMGSLEVQLQKLADERHAELSVEGTPRRLAPDVVLAVYRVAQEALTNAGKHAPGARVAVRLGYRPEGLALAVENSPPPSPPVSNELGSSGAGFGLQGIRERVLLLGGRVEARSNGGGWLVETEIPT